MTAHDDTEPDLARERLAQLRRPVAGRLRSAAVLDVAASLLWIGQAAFVADIFAALAGGTAPVTGWWGGPASFALIGLVRALIGYVSGGMVFAAAQDAIAAEREQLIGHSARRSPAGQGAFSSAAIASLGVEKLAAVAPYLTRYMPAMARTMAVPAAIALVAFAFSWMAGVILLVTGPMIPVFMALVGMAARDASERQMREIGTLNTLLLERIRALTDIRVLDATGRVIDGFKAGADDLRARTMTVLRIAFLSSTVLELFSAIGVALVAVYVGFALLGEISFGAWTTPLTLGEGIFLLLLAPDFYQPVRDLAAAWHDRAEALAVTGELAQVEREDAAQILGEGYSVPPLPGPAGLRTHGLVWRTPDGRAIRFPDFSIEPGEAVALTGHSGAGKSTLLALLAAMIPAAEGTIEVAGHPLRADTADAWRARLGWIGQAPHFVHASVRANLMPGKHEADGPALQVALEAASATAVVETLPKGLHTVLGELGHGVSGGEARRLMVARALCADADIILADEPTADLDADTARLITEGLLSAARQGATLIVATHDMTLARRMDRIVALKEVP